MHAQDESGTHEMGKHILGQGALFYTGNRTIFYEFHKYLLLLSDIWE